MSEDVHAVESSPAETVTATEPVTVANPAAEPKNTVQPTVEVQKVPDRRFQEVIAQKNEALKEREELAARVRELERSLQERTTAQEPEKPEEPIEAPQHLSQSEQVKWLIREHAKRLIKEETGMDLKQLGTAVATTKNTAEDYAERKFAEMCGSRGLDSKSSELRDYVQKMLRGGEKIEKTLEYAQKIYGTPRAETTNEPVATVETEGVSGVMTRPSKIPQTIKEAVEMAARGEAARVESTTERLERLARERAAQRTN